MARTLDSDASHRRGIGQRERPQHGFRDTICGMHFGGFHNESDFELVILAEFTSDEELMVVRALLEAEGIECVCPSMYSGRHGEGSVALRVRQQDLAQARAILDAPCEPDAADE